MAWLRCDNGGNFPVAKLKGKTFRLTVSTRWYTTGGYRYTASFWFDGTKVYEQTVVDQDGIHDLYNLSEGEYVTDGAFVFKAYIRQYNSRMYTVVDLNGYTPLNADFAWGDYVSYDSGTITIQ